MSQASAPADPVVILPHEGRALIAVLVVVAVAAGGFAFWSVEPRRCAFSYLAAWLFVASTSVGALAWLMLHHLTGAVWSVALRRLLENLAWPLPVIALGFLPIALNLHRVYPWADPSRLAVDLELSRKTGWLNPIFFTGRALFYLACWSLLAGWLARGSARLDQTGDPSELRRMRGVSAWGLVVVALTSTLAAFDWLMSLEPHWASTIFGVYFWSGSIVGALSALVLLALGLRSAGYLRRTVTVEHLHDLGKLLFGFVVFWAYIAFSQYFLIWYTNIPEETSWYLARRTGVWNSVSWSLVFGNFVVPFFLLLPRAVRRAPFRLGFVAVWLLVFHFVDLYWLVMPARHVDGFRPQWRDALVLLALVCLYGAAVVRACQLRPLVPVGDPRLAESLAFRNS